MPTHPAFCSADAATRVALLNGSGTRCWWHASESVRAERTLALLREICAAPPADADTPCYHLAGRTACFPSVVGVGFPKCGTRALFELLALHPDVAASSPKETDFFRNRFRPGLLDLPGYLATWPTGGDAHRRRVEFSQYARHDCRVRTDATAEATCPQAASQPATRMWLTLPPSTLAVAIVREPVARAYSHYTYFRTRLLGRGKALGGVAQRAMSSFEACVCAEVETRFQLQGGMVTGGYYAMFLEQWRRGARGLRLLVLTAEELRGDGGGAVLQRVAEAAGLRPLPWWLASVATHRRSANSQGGAVAADVARAAPAAYDWLRDHYRPWNARLARELPSVATAWLLPQANGARLRCDGNGSVA